MKRVIISINKDGGINAEVNGTKGVECIDYIPLLEAILEGKTTLVEYTHEYYQQENSIINIQEQNISIKE